MFVAENDYLIVRQSVKKNSELLTAGETKENNGVVVYAPSYFADEIGLNFVGKKIYFPSLLADKIRVNGEDLLVVKYENVFGFDE